MKIKFIHLKIFIILLFPTINIIAGSNMPQVTASSIITGKDHRQLKTYFENQSYLPNPFNDSIGLLLLKYFPREYQKGCKQMISKWGKATKGTSATAVKPIHFVNHSKNIQQLLIVYTCYSTAKGYEDLYYDERLAVLQVDSAHSSIMMIPNSKPCGACKELSHIGLMEDTLKIDNTDAISIIIGTSSENPCCSDSNKIEEVNVKYITVSQSEVKERLTLLVSRKETYHNSSNGDSTVISTRNIETIRDAKGNISSILLQTETIINGSKPKRGLLKYSWNRKRKAFDEEWN
jgi:hypothetical protein